MLTTVNKIYRKEIYIILSKYIDNHTIRLYISIFYIADVLLKIEKHEFRAWSKSAKKYFYGLEKAHLYDFDHNPDFVVEEYTNRYDCNHQKVFEGDIVSVDNVPGTIRVVVFQNGSFYLATSNSYEDYCEGNYYNLLLLSTVEDNEMTIIGHIHQEMEGKEDKNANQD